MAKTLIAYFSHAGQNYSHGSIRNLEVGNTEVIAKKLHAIIDSDLFYIDTVKKYPDDHMKKIAIAKQELWLFRTGGQPCLWRSLLFWRAMIFPEKSSARS